MKKLLAILTVMCMVLTTMIVPTLVFGNEGADDEETAVIGFDPWYNGENDMTFEGKCYGVSFDGGYNTGVPLSSTIGDAYSIITEPTSSSEDESFLGWRQHAVVEVDDGEGGSYFDFGDQVSSDIYSTEDVLAMDVPAEGVIFVGVWDGVESDSGDEGGSGEEQMAIVGFELGYDGDYEVTFEGQCGEDTFDGGYTTDIPVNGTIGAAYSITDPISENGEESFIGWAMHSVIITEEDFEIGDQIGDGPYSTAEVLEMQVPEDGVIFVGVWEGVESSGGDDGDSTPPVFFVFGSDNGMITYEWDEDGDTYSETWQSAMWMYYLDTTLESVWGQNGWSKITAVTKENAIFSGWKLYTGEDFTFEFVEAGGTINETDGVTKTYTETYYFDEEWEDNDGEMRPEGYYDEYLAIVGQHEVEEDVIYDISDLLSFVPENNIYFAVAQWDEVDLKTESIEDADPEEIVKMVSDDIKDIIASESDTEELSAEAIVEWIKETLAAAVTELIESEDSILTEDAKTTSYEITVVDADGFKVDNQDIPEEGVAITVPYPEGINKDNCDEYEFVILHMISEGNKAGEIEELDVIGITEDSLLVKVNSLSSFVVAYQEAPDDSQGGNEGTTPGGTTPGNTGNNTAQGGTTATTPDKAVDTGDDFNMAPFIAAMAIALAGVAAAMLRRKTVK